MDSRLIVELLVILGFIFYLYPVLKIFSSTPYFRRWVFSINSSLPRALRIKSDHKRMASQRSPLLYTSSMFIGIMFLIAGWTVLKSSPPPNELTYQNQIAKLDGVSENLIELQDYIDNQKSELIETEAYIKALEEENSKLEPVVQANRKAVEQILQLQQERETKSAWLGYLMSFLLGIFSSVVAEIIMARTRKGKPISTEDEKK